MYISIFYQYCQSISGHIYIYIYFDYASVLWVPFNVLVVNISNKNKCVKSDIYLCWGMNTRRLVFAWNSETDLITVWGQIYLLNQFGNEIFCQRNIYISRFWEKCAKFGGICTRMYLVWQRKMDEPKCFPESKFNFHNWNRMLK